MKTVQRFGSGTGSGMVEVCPELALVDHCAKIVLARAAQRHLRHCHAALVEGGALAAGELPA